jgi:hypothetical protein
MSRFVRRSLAILALAAALLCAVLAGSAAYTRRQAKTLVEDLSRLDTATNPKVLLRSLRQKHREIFAGEKCDLETCYYEFFTSNRVASTFHLAPRAEIRAAIILYGNSLRMISVQYTSSVFKVKSPIIYVQEDFCAVRTDITCGHFALNPHGRNVTPTWNGIVEFDQLATEQQKRAAWALNLDCVTAFRGCNDISKLLPTIWKLTSAGSVSTRVRSTADSIAESSESLPD